MSTVVASLNNGLRGLLTDDPRVVVLGEDLADPYGGAFKVTAGLSTAFPGRVLSTPISEAGIVGVSVGMAMRGLLPVVELMFGDFVMLAADQLVNHAARYGWLSKGKAAAPIVVRTPMGGRRRYGPTHSQSLEKHFIGVPGLSVVAAHPFGDPGALLRGTVEAAEGPTLFVEHKADYARAVMAVQDGERLGDLWGRVWPSRWPTVGLSYDSFSEADATIVAYGGMASLAVEAAEVLLMDDEIVAEVIVPTALSPLDLAPIVASLKRSGRLVVCEEGSQMAGWGAEVVRRVAVEAFSCLKTAPATVAAADRPIGASPVLEDAALPQVRDIVAAVRARVGEQA